MLDTQVPSPTEAPAIREHPPGPDRGPPRTAGPELTIVVPTFNERGNVSRLVARLDEVMTGVCWQAIFVDDNSPDGTAQAVKDMASLDSRILCLHRVNRRGLSGAVVEGAQFTFHTVFQRRQFLERELMFPRQRMQGCDTIIEPREPRRVDFDTAFEAL